MTPPLSVIRQESLPGERLAALKVVGDWQTLARDVPAAWRALNARCDPAGLSPVRVGVYPMRDQLSAAGPYTYWVAQPIAAHQRVPAGCELLVLAPARFAAARFQGVRREIVAGYRELHDWLRHHQLALDESGYGVERYTLVRGRPWEGEGDDTPFDMDLYLAVRAEATADTHEPA